MNIQISVEGTPVPSESFCCPTMSLRDAGPGFSVKPFELHIKTADLATLMNEAYGQFIREIKADDEAHGDPVEELAECGYPGSITDLFHHAKALDVVFGRYLVAAFLEKIQSADIQNPRHLYLTPHGEKHVTRCTFEGKHVVFRGMCAKEEVS